MKRTHISFFIFVLFLVCSQRFSPVVILMIRRY